jgi:hypothetical protein
VQHQQQPALRRRPGLVLQSQPADGHDLAARPDPVQSRGHRGAVRPGRGLGVDRGDGLGGGRRKVKTKTTAPNGLAVAASDKLTGFLQRPPALDPLDEAELLGWSVEIVRAARRNGYLASTADAIAVFETSILLAGMRDRANPTPYDFGDAAVTCIE